MHLNSILIINIKFTFFKQNNNIESLSTSAFVTAGMILKYKRPVSFIYMLQILGKKKKKISEDTVTSYKSL